MFLGVTALTLFDLVIRSMRKNIKHYYLYFFALIFSVVLYFVFASLQHDAAVVANTMQSFKMDTAFKVASILLLVIAGIFVIYANTIFLTRRSREIGLYQLIGLTKNAVARLLIIENILLSVGALVVGVLTGILVSRLFILLLMKLIGFEGVIEVSFSLPAIIQTVVVFSAIIFLTSLQMLAKVYRNTLLSLFNADKKTEHPKKPKTGITAIIGILGIGLIVFGYWLSDNMMNSMLFFNMLFVLFSTIFGTYLLFRVTIGWMLYRVRTAKNGHLSLYDSLSIAPLIHRLKGNANSLTLIAVLSAMTLAMTAGAYSMYYSTEKEARYFTPYDYMFDSEEAADEFVEELREHQIETYTIPFEFVTTEATLLADDVTHFIGDRAVVHFISAKQLEATKIKVPETAQNYGVYYDSSIYWMLKTAKVPFEIKLDFNGELLPIERVGEGNVINFPAFGSQVVLQDEQFQRLKEEIVQSVPDAQFGKYYAVNLTNPSQLALANEVQSDKATVHHHDFYSGYATGVKSNGLLIFIAGFLGLVFLISTGSILYFKQMTEAEQEKKSYTTLRQLGFTVQDIMKGIVRKQLFVFGLPLIIGLLHSIFAVKSASFLFMSDITIPVIISMSVYVGIYFIFSLLTIGYYKKTVKASM